jgi:ABC-type lipoprotein export system ATPase subunit
LGSSPDESPAQPTAPRPPAVVIKALNRVFDVGAEKVQAVKDVSLEIPAGKMVAVKGPSGSGKTTLLNMVAGLDEPTNGSVSVNGREIAGLSNKENLLTQLLNYSTTQLTQLTQLLNVKLKTFLASTCKRLVMISFILN